MSVISPDLIERTKKHEGFEALGYKDTNGHLTIGYGWNLETGIRQHEAVYILNSRLSEVYDELTKRLPYFEGLPELCKEVLTEMAFQLGSNGLLRFGDLFLAIKDHNWNKAADAMLDSVWHKQCVHRAEELAGLMRSVK